MSEESKVADGLLEGFLRGTFIEREIRRTNRNLLVTSLILLVGVGVYGYSQWRYYLNFFAGPTPMQGDAVARVKNVQQLERYYVRVESAKEYATGMQEVEEKSGVKTAKADYVLIEVGDVLLLVKKDLASEGHAYTGALVAVPGDVQRDVIGMMAKENPESAGDFLPFMLDETNFREDGYWGLGIAIPVILIALWMLRRVVMRTSSPETHPILVGLGRFGSIAEVVHEIDAEMKGEVYKFNSMKLTAHWLIYADLYRMQLMRLDELVWMYKKVTKHRTNFIPTGKSYQMLIYDRHGVELEVQGGRSEKKLDAALATVAAGAPRAVVGYTEELKSLQQKDKKGFAAELYAARKEEISG